MKKITLEKITLREGFWKNRSNLLSEEIIPYQWDTLNNRTRDVPLSYAVENFRIAAGESEGTPEGTIFQDSDVAKWIEAASYSLMTHPDEAMEKNIDELIRLIAKSQHENGYLNTFFTAKGIDQRWTDLVMGHEMYCAGHLIEAAVAYFQATGKRKLLDVMSKYADLIVVEFGPEEGMIHSYDGHPEIELALYRLSEATGNEKYEDLADYFINIRGTVKNYYNGVAAKEGMIPKSRWFESDYYLAHKPVREMSEVTGHAVRAVYLFAGMADQYYKTREPQIWETLTNLWDNLENKRVYITGAIGSQSHGERFTVDYDLPADRGYTETCASIGLIFWAWRMSLIDADSKYADMIERALYNGVLSGISLDGKGYFYVNPLEVKTEIAQYRHDLEHVKTHRVGWLDCACCPTNVARLIGSVAGYIYSTHEDSLYIHQFAASSVKTEVGGQEITLEQTTQYPWSGRVSLKLSMNESRKMKFFIRKPSWCDNLSISVGGLKIKDYSIVKGYILLERIWNDSDEIRLDLEMAVRYMQSNTKVHDNVGKVAITYGPLVYCFEEFDNGSELQELVLDTNGNAEIIPGDLEPSPSVNLVLDGFRKKNGNDALYHSLEEPLVEKVKIKAIPYFQWGNRGEDQEMRVWLRYK